MAPKRANPVKVSSPSDLLSQVARREGRREEKVFVTWRDVTSSSCGGTHAGKGGVERRTKLCRVGTTKGRHTRPGNISARRKERVRVSVFLKEIFVGNTGDIRRELRSLLSHSGNTGVEAAGHHVDRSVRIVDDHESEHGFRQHHH
ncbi:hypothetical protein TNIN_169321 [Trichonephila inaurata madagascariensis]|uniref:Uncharacterized protein n=1 Tax=Trichonephila inaurata madagascariensis TaxID=2747483 RepID=A0A8X6MDB4_9ARAC|nr:hypothetical protein TNIN_169321 [Trichonephila inaurata madagascariensis]